MTNKFSKKCLPIFFIITVILLFVYYIYDNFSRLHYLLNFSTSSLIIILVLSIVLILGRGATNCIIYRLLSVRLSLIEGSGVAVINTLGNLLPFSGGLIAKGMYLKSRHNLSYGHYFPATVTLLIAFLGVNGLIGLLTLGYITNGYRENTPLILLIAFGIMLLTTLLLWIPLPINIFPPKWQELLQRIKEGWQGLGKNKTAFLHIFVLQIILVSTMAARLYLIFQMLSQNAGYLHCLLFCSASILTRFVTIAPSGIGAREAIVGASGYVLGFEFGMCALAVMIDRIFAIIVCLVLAFVYSLFGIKLLGTTDCN
ncbi:MAG: lysylphosphatidylglycerol synthase transmembrane domain-containing protein [Bacteroidota bacterium]